MSGLRTHKILLGNVGQEVILAHGIATIWSFGPDAGYDLKRLLDLAFESVEFRLVDRQSTGATTGPVQRTQWIAFEPITLRIEEGVLAGSTWELTCTEPATWRASSDGESIAYGADDGQARLQCREAKFALEFSFHYKKDDTHRWWSQVRHTDHHLKYTLDRAKALELLSGVRCVEMEDYSYTWQRPEDDQSGEYVALMEGDEIDIYLNEVDGQLVLAGHIYGLGAATLKGDDAKAILRAAEVKTLRGGGTSR